MFLEVVVQRRHIVFAMEQVRRLAIESQDVAQHAVERRSKQIPPLGKQAEQRAALVLQPDRSHRTLKLMSLSRDATPSRSNIRTKFG